MRAARGGYTIIEVLIVLAVSGTLFIAAVMVFNGKQGRAQFTQTVQDLTSQMQGYANDVLVSLYPEADQYGCRNVGGKPQLTSTPGGAGANGDCIFLGKALLVDTSKEPSTISVYTVLGTRQNGGNLVTSFSQANPDPAADPNDASKLLFETYKLQGSSKIIWSRVNTSGLTAPPTSAPETDLVGFYSSLQTASSSGSQSLVVNGYPGADAGSLQSSIRTTTSLTPVQSWYMCVQSGSSNQFAIIGLLVSNTGVTTKINYVSSCS